MDYTVNPRPQGMPWGINQYDTGVWGQEGLEWHDKVINVEYVVIGLFQKVIHTKYRVKARYSGNEATLEDVYSYATRRYMSLGCLDGPLFPYKSKAEGDEVIR